MLPVAKTEPARVSGNTLDAIAYFDEDARGDLVEIRYHCRDCAGTEWFDYLPWPGFDFGEPPVHCEECSALINA